MLSFMAVNPEGVFFSAVAYALPRPLLGIRDRKPGLDVVDTAAAAHSHRAHHAAAASRHRKTHLRQRPGPDGEMIRPTNVAAVARRRTPNGIESVVIVVSSGLSRELALAVLTTANEM